VAEDEPVTTDKMGLSRVMLLADPSPMLTTVVTAPTVLLTFIIGPTYPVLIRNVAKPAVRLSAIVASSNRYVTTDVNELPNMLTRLLISKYPLE
jgi:hypothetical protein